MLNNGNVTAFFFEKRKTYLKIKWKTIATPFNFTWQEVRKMPKPNKLEHLQYICILNKSLYSDMNQSQDIIKFIFSDFEENLCPLLISW